MFNSGLLKEFAAKQMQKQMEKQMAEQAMMQEQAMPSNPMYQVGGIKGINDRRRQKVLLNLASQFFDSDNEMQVSPVEFISYLSEQQVSPEEILGIFRYFGQDDTMVSDLIGSVFGQSPQEYVDFDSVASAKYGGKLKRKLRKAQNGKWAADLTNRMEGFEDPSDVTVVYDGDDRYESIFDPAYRDAVRNRNANIANIRNAVNQYRNVWYTQYPLTNFTTTAQRQAWARANPLWVAATNVLGGLPTLPAGTNPSTTNAAGLVYNSPIYNFNNAASLFPAAVSFVSPSLPEDIDEAQFRQWVNTYYPEYAKANEIGLNVPSKRNNRYIRSAWYELGDQYRPIVINEETTDPVEEATIVEETPSPIIEKKGYETKPLVEINRQKRTNNRRWDDSLKMYVLDEGVKGSESTGVDIGGRTIKKKYGGNNINDNTMKKNFYGQIVNAMRNRGLPKAQVGKTENTTPFEEYVEKYPNGASDTLFTTRGDVRDLLYHELSHRADFLPTSRFNDLQNAYRNTYGNNDVSDLQSTSQNYRLIEDAPREMISPIVKKMLLERLEQDMLSKEKIARQQYGGLRKAQNGGENEYYIPRLPIKEYDDTTRYYALDRPYNEYDMSTQLYALNRPYDMNDMFDNYGPPRRGLRNRMSGFMDNLRHGSYQALDRMGFNPYNREYPNFIDSYDRDSPFYQGDDDDMRNNFVYDPDDYYDPSRSRRAEPLPKAYQDELMREVIRNLYNKR